MNIPDSHLIKAPWNLRGQGYMFLYNFPKDWARKANFLPIESSGEFQGGLGTVMLVDYQSSNVGPYQELLIIPGKYSWLDYKTYAISRIWVSSEASVINGQKNWGIPKKLASFHRQTKPERHESWEVTNSEGRSFFNADLSYGRVPFPMHTALLPFPLLQTWQGQRFLTAFSGYGLARLAKLDRLELDAEIFPDISVKKPLIGLRVDHFHIRFPEAKMISKD